MTGCAAPTPEQAAAAPPPQSPRVPASKVSPELEVVKNAKYKETSEGGLAVSLVLCHTRE